MNVALIVVRGKPEGMSIPLVSGGFLIGRGPECHLRPNSDLVGRRHCLITLVGNEVRVRDLQSANGTLINGERISSEVVVHTGDLLQVGPLVFEFSTATSATKRVESESAAEEQVAQWLVGDQARGAPDGGSGVYSGDTKTLQTFGTADPSSAAETGKSSSDQQDLEPSSDTDRPRSLKTKGRKTRITKTHEDTSRAASDILDKMLKRSHKRQ
ncbi:MAG: FHA domain-containing protein [Planctomycetes bacterium]|nr:FHA domain-containing protein [Planctomycetota bacterium]